MLGGKDIEPVINSTRRSGDKINYVYKVRGGPGETGTILLKSLPSLLEAKELRGMKKRDGRLMMGVFLTLLGIVMLFLYRKYVIDFIITYHTLLFLILMILSALLMIVMSVSHSRRRGGADIEIYVE